MHRHGRSEARVIIEVEGDADDDIRKMLKGLRVLVVGDGDATLARRLCFLGCIVTTCRDQRAGISTLEDNSRQFDMAFANVDQQKGLQFVAFFGWKLGLPAVVMCTSENKRLIKEGIKRGACESLVKPWVDDELKKILQRVVQNQIRFPDGRGKSARRDEESKDASEPPASENLSRVWRLVWTDELKANFDNAINRLKDEKVTPKKIIEIMTVPGLTMQHVSSLQKYRSELKKKGTPTPDPRDDNNSKSPGDAGSNSTQGMVIKETTPISMKEAARLVEPLQKPNLTSFLTMDDDILQPPYRDMHTQPNFWGAESSNMATQLKDICAQSSTRCPDEFARTTLSSSQLITNRGFGVSNQLQGNGLPLQPLALSYEDSPPWHNLSPVDYQPRQLDQLLMDLGVPTVDAILPQVIREPYPYWVAQDNIMIDPVADATLDVAGSSSADRTVMMNNNLKSSDPCHNTNHDATTVAEQGQRLWTSADLPDLVIGDDFFDWDFEECGP